MKGWSIERAADILERHGARNLCLNAGGDIVVRGEPEAGRPWRVGIRHPGRPDRSAAVVELRRTGCDRHLGHLRAGRPHHRPRHRRAHRRARQRHRDRPDLTYADAFATAVFVMGVDGLLWLHERHPEYAGFVITHDELTYATPTFRGV